MEFKSKIIHLYKKNGKSNTHLKISVKLIFCIHVSIHIDFFFKCKKPLLITVVLQFFLIHPHFNGKISFIIITVKPQLVRNDLKS